MKSISMSRIRSSYSILLFFLAIVLITGCVGGHTVTDSAVHPKKEAACPETTAMWMKPPGDATVSGTPVPGYFYANGDQTILVSAWWAAKEGSPLRAIEEGNKIGWFRPQGADLTITGQRIDGPALPLKAEVPCCYTGQFQATGLIFPTSGCWKITGQSAGRSITFVVLVEP